MENGRPDGEKTRTSCHHEPAPQFLDSAALAQLLRAAQDFRFLLGRGYPRQASLTLVGNRYNLPGGARQILQRGVFSPAVAAPRRQKLSLVQDLAGQPLALDGHNVVLTLECASCGVPVVAADDGFIRDIGQISAKFRPTDCTEQALWRLCRYFSGHGVGPVLFWYDAPMSRSGELAALTRYILHACQLPGDAQATPVPEKQLLVFPGVIGSSDTYLIDRSSRVMDAAGEIIRQLPQSRIIFLAEPLENLTGRS